MPSSDRSGDGADHVGDRWGNGCPNCGLLETRDYGPGRYPSPDRCPECNWPMNVVDLDYIDEEPGDEYVR